ncbi:hypothetical protein ES705_07282 [subsurface metagenome]
MRDPQLDPYKITGEKLKDHDKRLKEVEALLIQRKGDANTFIGHGDTPASYSGKQGQVVAVNTGEDALEFASGVGGEFVENDIYGSGWDGDATHAPSQNAVYDKIDGMDTLIAANTTVTEVEAVITAELVDGQSIDLAIDSLIATHDAISDAHHTRYADSEVEAIITAELVGGQSIDNAIDALISTHVGLSDPHTPYFLADGSRQLDGDLDFTGAQAITTTAGALTLNPATTLEVTPTANFAAGINVTGTADLGAVVINTDGITVDNSYRVRFRAADGDVSSAEGAHIYMNDGNNFYIINREVSDGGILLQLAPIVSWQVRVNPAIADRAQCDLWPGPAGGAEITMGGEVAIRAGTTGETFFNNAARDINFRVASVGNANMLFVDAELNRVGIGVADPHSTLEVAGAISSAVLILSAAGPTDNLDVSGVNTVFIDTSSNDVTLGGTVGGVDGQILAIVVHDSTNNFAIEDREGTGNQDFYLHAEIDEVMIGEPGGWVFVNHGGAHWHDASHAKHV